jgi:hypothetical protein
MATGHPWNKGLFVGGSDELIGWDGKATRIDGFWLQQRSDKEPGRCGYWHLRSITLTTGTPYVLSFYYRTDRLPDKAATIWLSYSEPDIFFAHDYGLSSTGGEWWHFVVVGWNRSKFKAPIRPLLRSFAHGAVEFDDVKVRMVLLHEGISINDKALFWVSGLD